MKQLKHLPRFLTDKEKAAIKFFLVLMGLSLLISGTKYASDHVVRVPTIGGEYVEAAVGNPRTINPILNSGNAADADIIKLVYTGLMRTNERGELVPDLAATTEVSPDGKTYTVTIKDGVRWQDGEPFTAKDVVATIGFIKTPGWNSPLAGLFKNVAADASDDRTVRFTLEEPYSPFLSALTVGILPAHLWQDAKPEYAARAELNLKPIGTGPYKFKSLVKDKKGSIRSYTLTRNENYYGDGPLISAITFKYYPDFPSAIDALSAKKADGISYLPLETRGEVEKIRNVDIYSLHLPQYTAVFFNQKKNVLVRSRAVRQALALAVDKERIVREALQGSAELAFGPIPPGFLGYDEGVKKYGFDLKAAADLLDQEGWKLDADGIRKKTTVDKTIKDPAKATTVTPMELTLTTVDAKENIAAAQVIKENWESLGVKTDVNVVPASKIQKENIRVRDYDALLYGEIIGPDSDPYPFWHSSQNEDGKLNLALFSNRRADELLEKARFTNKPDERASFYKEFQSILAEEEPAVFLYRTDYIHAVSRKVKGMGTETVFAPADRFTDVANWYIEMKDAWR